MIIDNEKVYDEEIEPLMCKIIEICGKNQLPMFATFLYKHDPTNILNKNATMHCTTSIPISTLYPEDEEAGKYRIIEQLLDLVY